MKRLSIFVLLVALSAHALSLKDWENKSDPDQLNYLGACVVSLTADVAKTDPALALKIKSWYGNKPPGHKYTDGVIDLMGRIVQLEEQAGAGKADLSKIEVEDIVYSVTAAKFKLPPRDTRQDLGDFKKDAPAPPPAPAGNTAAPPAPRTKPIMVGKIDVSHFAGLRSGDTPARVVSLYGQAVKDYGGQKGYGSGALLVQYKTDGGVYRVEVSSSDVDVARSHAGNDALLDLFGRTEADAVALLGPPKWSEDIDAPTRYLYWNFPMYGHPPEDYANAGPFRRSKLTSVPVRVVSG